MLRESLVLSLSSMISELKMLNYRLWLMPSKLTVQEWSYHVNDHVSDVPVAKVVVLANPVTLFVDCTSQKRSLIR